MSILYRSSETPAIKLNVWEQTIMETLKRCDWVGDDPLYLRYHDEEWGRPLYGDQALFECLCLEGQQAGLSWITVLRKREHYRRCFKQFDPLKVARMRDATIEKLLQDSGLIRNRLKLYGIRKNARACLAVIEEEGSFSDYLWSFVEGQPLVRRPDTLAEVPVSTAVSDAMSKDLKKRGFTFVGSTICYAFMQAVGMVDDHMDGCFCATR